MTIKYVAPKKGITIQCSGPDGNAYTLLGLVNDLGKKMGWSNEEIEKVRAEMKSSDYEHLKHTFDKHFGFYVTLEFDVHPSSKHA